MIAKFYCEGFSKNIYCLIIVKICLQYTTNIYLLKQLTNIMKNIYVYFFLFGHNFLLYKICSLNSEHLFFSYPDPRWIVFLFMVFTLSSRGRKIGVPLVNCLLWAVVKICKKWHLFMSDWLVTVTWGFATCWVALI